MKVHHLLLLLFCANFLYKALSRSEEKWELAKFPPRGWNSYDSFSWIIDESAFLQNAKIVAQKLLPFGYEYVVVDFLWYRKNVDGAYVDSYGYDCIDEWGRPYPDPERWPLSRDGKGFTQVAKKIHEMGLKFGIHVMRGISKQAVDTNIPILDVRTGVAYEEDSRNWLAKDIGIKFKACAWMQNGFMSVNTDLGAGRAFLRSLYHQYADWGVDFVKLDCVFGDDFDPKEIITVSELLEELESPVVLSISPGTSVNPSMAEIISKYVNMYRITADDWDTWPDVTSHFNISRDFAADNKIGGEGLQGKSWPDLDMLPLGWLTDPGVRQGAHRKCNLTLDEQKTQMTLWAMAKSPLMFGGDLRQIDETTLSLITNPTILEINSYSSHNTEFPYVYSREILRYRIRNNVYSNQPVIKLKSVDLSNCKLHANKIWRLNENGTLMDSSGLCAIISSNQVNEMSRGIRSWIATGRRGEIYVAFFNLNPVRTRIIARISDFRRVIDSSFFSKSSCNCTEIWSGKSMGTVGNKISSSVNSHGCSLFVLYC